MLINLFTFMMVAFVFFATGVLVTVTVLAMKRLLEWIDVVCWNAMIWHGIRKAMRNNEKH